MDNLTRVHRYLKQRGKSNVVLVVDGIEVIPSSDLTGPQRRRAKVPAHEHVKGQRCVRCAPYPSGSATILTGKGPRDWSPPKDPFSIIRGRRSGKSFIMDEVNRGQASQ